MGKIAFLRSCSSESREFRACFRTDKTHYDSLLTERITSKIIPRNQSRNFCGVGGFTCSNGSVVEKCDVIEIVEITPTRQTVIIQDPARHERIQRTHLEIDGLCNGSVS